MSFIFQVQPPWIEQVACCSVLGLGIDDHLRSAKIGQILSISKCYHSPHVEYIMHLSDRAHSIDVELSRETQAYMKERSDKDGVESQLLQGSIVRISDWQVSYHSQQKHINLVVPRKVDVLGCYGMAVVGDPVDVHQSIEVRRALGSVQAHCTHEGRRTDQQLLPVGDARQLLTHNIEFLSTLQPTSLNGSNPPSSVVARIDLPVGNVMSLLQSGPAKSVLETVVQMHRLSSNSTDRERPQQREGNLSDNSLDKLLGSQSADIDYPTDLNREKSVQFERGTSRGDGREQLEWQLCGDPPKQSHSNNLHPIDSAIQPGEDNKEANNNWDDYVEYLSDQSSDEDSSEDFQAISYILGPPRSSRASGRESLSSECTTGTSQKPTRYQHTSRIRSRDQFSRVAVTANNKSNKHSTESESSSKRDLPSYNKEEDDNGLETQQSIEINYVQAKPGVTDMEGSQDNDDVEKMEMPQTQPTTASESVADESSSYYSAYSTLLAAVIEPAAISTTPLEKSLTIGHWKSLFKLHTNMEPTSKRPRGLGGDHIRDILVGKGR